jgi:hypothetical protein
VAAISSSRKLRRGRFGIGKQRKWRWTFSLPSRFPVVEDRPPTQFFSFRPRGQLVQICSLEAQKWSESNPQIVVPAVVKVHFVPHIKPQTNWPDPSLDSSSGIKNGVHVLCTQVIDRTDERPAVAGAPLRL